jgi:hypothetical protein
LETLLSSPFQLPWTPGVVLVSPGRSQIQIHCYAAPCNAVCDPFDHFEIWVSIFRFELAQILKWLNRLCGTLHGAVQQWIWIHRSPSPRHENMLLDLKWRYAFLIKRLKNIKEQNYYSMKKKRRDQLTMDYLITLTMDH